MNKIWIVRERLDWHNADAADETNAYGTRKQAEQALVEKFEETELFFRVRELGLIDEMRKKTVNSGTLVTSRDDYYSIWIEEIDFNN